MTKLKQWIKSLVELFSTSWRAFSYCLKKVPVDTVLLSIVYSLIGVVPFVQSKILSKIIDSLVSIATGKLVIHGISFDTSQGLIALLVAYSIMTVVPEFLFAIQGFYYRAWIFKIQQIFQKDFSGKKVEIDIALHESPRFQDLLKKAEWNGYWSIVNFVEIQMYNFQNVLGLIVASIIVISFSYKLYLVIVIASIPKLISELKYGKQVWGIFSEESRDQRLYDELRENFKGTERIVETKLLQSGKKILDIIDALLVKFNSKQIKAEKAKMLMKMGAETIAMCGYAYAIFVIVGQVSSGLLAIGGMTFLLTSLSSLSSSVAGFFLNIARGYKEGQYVKSIFEVMDTPDFLPRNPHPIKLNLDKSPEIIFENVAFRYPAQIKNILHGINLTIRAGEKIAWIGANGAGKTTMVKLLCRIYDPTEGRITVNGVDLRDLDIDEWWTYLGVLFQDFSTYNFKAKDAIAAGRMENATDDERVIEAAKLSDAHSFINEWEYKYEHMIGREFEGVEPSKGQRQKLALARILYRKAKVLILDEPTAAVDAHSEATIFESLENMPSDVTAIFISHRFSTVRKADRIIVFENGTIAELGSHEELMRKEGIYAGLFNEQAKGYQESIG